MNDNEYDTAYEIAVIFQEEKVTLSLSECA